MQIASLLDIPMASFFRTIDSNHSVLYELRGTARRTDGYFLVKNTSDLGKEDTFTLTGQEHKGQWYLGRIRTIKDPCFDYAVEIYRRTRHKEFSEMGTVLRSDALDNHDLAQSLREMAKGSLDFSYASKWDIVKASTFSNLGFDVM